LRQTQQEMQRLPALIRPMAGSSFKNKAGQSVQEWVKSAEALEHDLKSSDGMAEQRLKDQLPGLIESLERLQSYYHDAPAENARNIRDAATREAMARQMAEREQITSALIAMLRSV
jgi:hypothetical protein